MNDDTKFDVTMKIGDKVRFLNTTGGGVISRFISKDVVSVLEDDGFETPALIRECVVVADVNENNVPLKKDTKPPAQQSYITPSAPVTVEEKPVLFEETPEGEQLTVALAFVPHDVKRIQTTDLDWFLVNDSNYSLYYTISSVKNDDATLLSHGIVHLNTTFFLQEIQKEQLNDYEKINVQFVAFKTDKPYHVKPSISLTVKTKLVNFYKLHSFSENDYFDEPAMIIPIITNDRLDIPFYIQAEDLQPKDVDEKPAANKTQIPEDKNAVVEVDLHINQLIDNTAGLSATDMLNYQLKKFNDTLAEYKGKKGQRIVFIHGKGNGVLRNELIKELKKNYPAYTYQDASFREYGFGATLITVK